LSTFVDKFPQIGSHVTNVNHMTLDDHFVSAKQKKAALILRVAGFHITQTATVTLGR